MKSRFGPRRRQTSEVQVGDTIFLQRDPLQIVTGVRRSAGFNTATKVIKPKKGKGSYDRHAAKRVDWQDPVLLPEELELGH